MVSGDRRRHHAPGADPHARLAGPLRPADADPPVARSGADILSTRASALAKLAAEITRAEEAYARRRVGFGRACATYQRRLHLLRLPLEDKIAAIVRRQAYLEGELSVAAALIETSAPRDAAGIEAVMSSLQARLPDLAPR